MDPTLSYSSLPQPASSYSGLFSHPTLAYPFRQPSTSYTGVVIQPTPTYHSLLRPTLQWSAILAYSGSPSYRMLPRIWSVPAYLLVHPRTACSLPHHTSYLNVRRPTLDWSASLPCRTAYHNLLRPTLSSSSFILPFPTLDNRIVPLHTL